VSELKIPLEVAGIQQICKRLHMPTIATQCARLAEQAIKEKQSHLIYLEMLLEAELEERERNVMERRLKEARFPKVKTLEEFNFEVAPHLPATGLRKLAEGQYIEKTEPLVFIGDTGTGKTHLATALGVAACRQRRRVRFTTAAELVNDLIEARQRNEVSRVVNRWLRYELIVLDEMAYVAMPDAAVIVTTNLPFSEWTTMFPNARLCKAMVDRLTDQAHIIDTGKESYRLQRTLAKNKGGRR
jgi:DNA replication protein DnaC